MKCVSEISMSISCVWMFLYSLLQRVVVPNHYVECIAHYLMLLLTSFVSSSIMVIICWDCCYSSEVCIDNLLVTRSVFLIDFYQKSRKISYGSNSIVVSQRIESGIISSRYLCIAFFNYIRLAAEFDWNSWG